MNKLRGEVKITIEGEEYILKSTFEACMLAEDAAETGLPDMSIRVLSAKFGVKHAVAIIYGGLVAGGVRKYTFLELGKVLKKEGFGNSRIISQSVKLLNFMVSQEDRKEAEKKPKADPSTLPRTGS